MSENISKFNKQFLLLILIGIRYESRFYNRLNLIYIILFKKLDNSQEDFESLINDSTFTSETLKDDGFVLGKIPIYLKSIYSIFKFFMIIFLFLK